MGGNELIEQQDASRRCSFSDSGERSADGGHDRGVARTPRPPARPPPRQSSARSRGALGARSPPVDPHAVYGALETSRARPSSADTPV